MKRLVLTNFIDQKHLKAIVVRMNAGKTMKHELVNLTI